MPVIMLLKLSLMASLKSLLGKRECLYDHHNFRTYVRFHLFLVCSNNSYLASKFLLIRQGDDCIAQSIFLIYVCMCRNKASVFCKMVTYIHSGMFEASQKRNLAVEGYQGSLHCTWCNYLSDG